MDSDSFRPSNQHYGYEIEAIIIQLFEESKFIQWRDFKNANPNLFDNAFRRRLCKRMLRYIGQHTSSSDGGFFVQGNVYKSLDFNGATYSIEGYSDSKGVKLIGCNHFEWIKNEKEEG